jgi:hypothetical protein
MKIKTSASVGEVRRIGDFLFPPVARRPRNRPPDPQIGYRDAALLFFALYVASKKQSSQHRAVRHVAEGRRRITGRAWSNKSAWRQYQELLKHFRNSNLPEGVLVAIQMLTESLAAFDAAGGGGNGEVITLAGAEARQAILFGLQQSEESAR